MIHSLPVQTQVPRLTVCWLLALRRIQGQMAAGCELRDMCLSDKDLPVLQSAGAQWLEDNCALLRECFDLSCFAREYELAFGMPGDSSPATAASRAEFVASMNSAITGLWSVMQRLEFLADPIGQSRMRWSAVRALHQLASPGPSNAYYVPS